LAASKPTNHTAHHPVFNRLTIIAMKKYILFCIVLFWVFTTIHVIAQETAIQDTALIYRIEMQDGNEFIGHIKTDTLNQIILETTNLGQLSINKEQIKRITTVEPGRIIRGKIWLDNPQAARYFWAPNGYGLKQGEGYYQNIWVLFNQASYGVSNHFSVGVGVVPMFLLNSRENPIWITPKFSIPVIDNKLNVGIGTIFATVTNVNQSSAGLLYGTVTYGTRDKNISLGMAYGYTMEDMAHIPLINLSGMARLRQRLYFVSENYIVIANGEVAGFISAGFRSITKKVALDYGLFMPYASGIETIVAVPWIGISVPFGK
jgi:hypothetical protein